MNRRFLFLLALLATALGCVAQTFTLRGRVTDGEGNPVEFASVTCPSQGRATVTSLQGQYALRLLTADSVVVKFSMLGYRTKTRVLRRPKGTQTLQVTLTEQASTLGEVTVAGQKIQSGQTQDIGTKPLRSLPSTTGNAVEELIQSQAGVSTPLGALVAI